MTTAVMELKRARREEAIANVERVKSENRESNSPYIFRLIKAKMADAHKEIATRNLVNSMEQQQAQEKRDNIDPRANDDLVTENARKAYDAAVANYDKAVAEDKNFIVKGFAKAGEVVARDALAHSLARQRIRDEGANRLKLADGVMAGAAIGGLAAIVTLPMAAGYTVGRINNVIDKSRRYVKVEKLKLEAEAKQLRGQQIDEQKVQNKINKLNYGRTGAAKFVDGAMVVGSAALTVGTLGLGSLVTVPVMAGHVTGSVVPNGISHAKLKDSKKKSADARLAELEAKEAQKGETVPQLPEGKKQEAIAAPENAIKLIEAPVEEADKKKPKKDSGWMVVPASNKAEDKKPKQKESAQVENESVKEAELVSSK